MGGNPFAITSEELLKRQQGIQGIGDSGKTENTKETREAKETEKIKSTDIYSLAGQNGGSRATTNGVFENYDGFTKTSINSDDECDDATSDAKSAQSEAGSAKSKANNASQQAQEDKKTLTKLSKQTTTKEKQTTEAVSRNNSEIESICCFRLFSLW